MITIVGADWCPACNRAKKLAKECEIKYKYIHIPPGQAGWDLVEAISGKRSIPQIFYHFGGSKEFREALNSVGELTQ
jgi:glutaredoxin